jgi:hypothetical protein
MGTAGPLALARQLLDDGSGQPFFVLNRWAQRLVLAPVCVWLVVVHAKVEGRGQHCCCR